MDVCKIKDYILQDDTRIEELLHKAEFAHIKPNGKEYRCAIEEGGNPTAVRVNINTLAANNFHQGIKGDIITLLQDKLQLNFQKTLQWICKILNLNYGEYEEKKDIQLPFGGYFKKIKHNIYYNPDYLKTYDETVLNRYAKMPNMMFLEDNISIETQEFFGVGYDNFTDRITVPWYSVNGELVGVMGRLNQRKVEEGVSKWFPVIPFPKSQTLFGYHQNYKYILDKGIVFMGESEKFPMQLHSMGLKNGLGNGGSMITEFKANHIKTLRPKTIIACYDEGLEEEIILREIEKLKSDNLFYKNKVGYIHDKDNIYLPKGSKSSPSDLGKDIFESLVKNCTVWV